MTTLITINRTNRSTEYGALTTPCVSYRHNRTQDTVGWRRADGCASKVDRIRRQLAAGAYDVEQRLDAVLDKILKAIYA